MRTVFGLVGFVMFEIFQRHVEGIFVSTWIFDIGIFLATILHHCQVVGEMDEVLLLFYKMEME